MSDSVFLDTNILVYAYDQHDPRKQNKAQELLTDGIEQENLLICLIRNTDNTIPVARTIHGEVFFL